MPHVDLEQAEHPITKSKFHKIIIVDDDEAVRDSLCVLLSLSGFDATAFESGFELQNAMQTLQADCLIIDLNMPGMSGLELIAWLKASGYTTPVILISANFDCSVEARARQDGVTMFLEKPFCDKRLIETICALQQ